ncbi:hypothetical protein AVEN_190651-1 [Araneus ventricosus]|uniref:Uncharacterized protein n=1 Tax=Araneus ventricosus TaxID=182803 RepID=A0A4Y1ZP92_ARAVE|nr:hypothetical protein AVEN_190651-1 [Araneus ventricosus]
MKVKIYFRSSPSFAQSPTMGSMNAAAFSTGSLTFGLSQANSQQSFQPAPQIVNVASLAPSSVPSSSMQFGAPSSMNMSSEMERFHKPSKGVSFVAPTQTVARDNSGVRHMAVAQRTAPDFKVLPESPRSPKKEPLPFSGEVLRDMLDWRVLTTPGPRRLAGVQSTGGSMQYSPVCLAFWDGVQCTVLVWRSVAYFAKKDFFAWSNHDEKIS